MRHHSGTAPAGSGRCTRPVKFSRTGRAKQSSSAVSAYLTTTDWAEYLELAEGLNMRILEIVSQAGANLFMPTSTLIIEQSAAAGEATGISE